LSREQRQARRKARRANRKNPLRPLDANDQAALLHLKEVIEEALSDGWDRDDALDILEAAAEAIAARRDTP